MKRWGIVALVALALAGCTDNHEDSPSPPTGDSRLEMPPEVAAYVDALRAEDVEGVRVHLVAIEGGDEDIVGARITAECAEAEIDQWSRLAQVPDIEIYITTSPINGVSDDTMIRFERPDGAAEGKGVWMVDDEWKVLASASPECLAPS